MVTSQHHLHARKKQQPPLYDEELGKQPSITREELKKRKRFTGAPELKWAFSSVGSFLALGLFLGYFLLHHQHRKVILHVMKDPWAHGGAIIHRKPGFHHHFYSGPPRFVTVIMPSVVNPAGRGRRLKSIQDTWGPYARAIFVVHDVSEFADANHLVIDEKTSSLSDPYAYPQLLLIPKNMTVDQGLPRLYHTIRTVFERVNPDFAFFVNDHTFVFPEHLCKFLEFRHADQDLYAGHALRNGKEEIFNSGAAGYILSRSTMQRMVRHWDKKDPECWIGSGASDWIQGNPGLATVKCLNSLGVKATDTRARHTWHRFHAFPLTRLVTGAVDEWYRNKHKEMPSEDFDESYSTLLAGEDCCSIDSISFHYVEYMETKAFFATHKALINNPHMRDPELKTMMIKLWPTEFKDLGGYSRGLPKEDDQEGWATLLKVIRKISNRATYREC